MTSPQTMDVEPFHLHVPDDEVADLRRRLATTRWPDPAPEDGWARGVPLADLRDLAAYWAEGYDWRRHEAALDAWPQAMASVDGQRTHLLHVRSPQEDALPLVLIHGWPSSPVEFLRVLDALTDPAASGGDPADAFHVVVPGLPGYGLSTPLAGPGWGNLYRVGFAWTDLLTALGYERFGVHATDAGTGVAGALAMAAPERVVGVHMTGTTAAMPFGPPLSTEGLDAADRARVERFNEYQRDGLGYLHQMATRPQTVAYGLTDSPVAHLAWIVEKFHEWTDPAAQRPQDAVDVDQLLTLVSLSWFTRAAASSANAVYEGMQAYRQMAEQAAGDAADHDASGDDGAGGSGPPFGVAVFAADTTVRSVMDPAGTFAHWANYDVGGHFPAMEVPDLLVDDVRAFFRPLR